MTAVRTDANARHAWIVEKSPQPGQLADSLAHDVPGYLFGRGHKQFHRLLESRCSGSR
jgi:hypothetical protein